MQHVVDAREQRDRQLDKVRYPATQAVARERCAAMRRRDEDRALELRHRPEVEQRIEPVARSVDLVFIQVVVVLEDRPKLVVRARDHQPGDHTAHAVPDDDGVVRRRGHSVRIEVPERGLEGVANRHRIHENRRIRRVVHLPDLEMFPQCGVALDLVGQVHPCLGTACQSVQHENHAAPGVEGLHQVDMRANNAAVAPEQCAQRLFREARAGQPETVPSREIARQRHGLMVDLDGRFAIRVIDDQCGDVRGEYVLERCAVEAQQQRERRRRHFAVDLPGLRVDGAPEVARCLSLAGVARPPGAVVFARRVDVVVVGAGRGVAARRRRAGRRRPQGFGCRFVVEYRDELGAEAVPAIRAA